jgi:hypothetical protein
MIGGRFGVMVKLREVKVVLIGGSTTELSEGPSPKGREVYIPAM